MQAWYTISCTHDRYEVQNYRLCALGMVTINKDSLDCVGLFFQPSLVFYYYGTLKEVTVCSPHDRTSSALPGISGWEELSDCLGRSERGRRVMVMGDVNGKGGSEKTENRRRDNRSLIDYLAVHDGIYKDMLDAKVVRGMF